MSRKSQSYQDSMEKLEAILERIDDTDVGVDELAENVKEAAQLLSICRKILTETEKEVQGALDQLEADFRPIDD